MVDELFGKPQRRPMRAYPHVAIVEEAMREGFPNRRRGYSGQRKASPARQTLDDWS